MLRWRQRADNPMQMTLEVEVVTEIGEQWQAVPMVDVNGEPLKEHPLDTKRKQKERAKVLKEMVKKSKEKAK